MTGSSHGNFNNTVIQYASYTKLKADLDAGKLANGMYVVDGTIYGVNNNSFIGSGKFNSVSDIPNSPGIYQVGGKLITVDDNNRKITLSSLINERSLDSRAISPIYDLFMASDQKVSENAMCSALTTWLNANATTVTTAFSFVRYYDPVNGSDSNSGRSPLAPQKTIPAAPSAGQVVAIKGGTTTAFTTSMLPNAGALIVGYDTDLYGQPVITGEAITSAGDKNRTIRIQNANVSLANLAIKGPVGDGSSGNNVIQCGTGGSGLNVLGCTIYANPGAETIGISVGSNVDFVIEHNTIKTTWGIGLGGTGTITKPQYIRFNRFECDITGLSNWCFDNGDCITLGDPGFDWGGYLRITHNEFSSWHENAFDCNKSSGAVFAFNNVHQIGKYQRQAAIAVLMGASSALVATKNIVIGNYFHDFIGNGLHTRGCINGLIIGNVFASLQQGVAFGVAGSNYNRAWHNTFYDMHDQSEFWSNGQIISPYTTTPDTPCGIRFDSNVDYVEAFNNIIHMRNSGRYIDGNPMSNSRYGGNIYCGDVYPDNSDYTTKLIAQDLYVKKLENVLNTTNFKPIGQALNHKIVSLSALDSIIGSHIPRYAGAIQW